MRQSRRDIHEKIAAALDPERRARYEAIARDAGQGNAARPDSGTPGRVYVIAADAAPSAVAVRLGVTDGSHTEVLAGDLDEGAGVIVGGGPRAQAAAEPVPSRPRAPRLF
jgi:HlyD family secretion protein